jgi:oxygen-independent coproporphyrinogen III oxidase
VPFCRTKCTYCNFASNVFSRAIFSGYVERVCENLRNALSIADQNGGYFENKLDSIYLGGGTPTLLDITALERLFVTISQNFEITADAEITVECAPGTLNDSVLEVLLCCGVNRVSLGVQSFVDEEARSVGRLHNRTVVFDDIARLRKAGITNINIDLIAGLPHQTAVSWEASITEALNTGAPHISVYMLEVDEDSRLGRELTAGGSYYHAHFVPDEDLVADLYEAARERFDATGIKQYEISNFARERRESRHNLKYWLRQPYLGFGVDAHSMLFASKPLASTLFAKTSGCAAVRFNTPDSIEQFMGSPVMDAAALQCTAVSEQAFLQEAFFLGLRLNRGVSLQDLRQEFGDTAVEDYRPTISELEELGLLKSEGERIFLTVRGRLLSNEVFQKFLSVNETLQSSR